MTLGLATAVRNMQHGLPILITPWRDSSGMQRYRRSRSDIARDAISTKRAEKKKAPHRRPRWGFSFVRMPRSIPGLSGWRLTKHVDLLA
jgi:hypothetical protein